MNQTVIIPQADGEFSLAFDVGGRHYWIRNSDLTPSIEYPSLLEALKARVTGQIEWITPGAEQGKEPAA
jgi:hypothetical protein